MKKIILIGIPGCGKSTLGKQLAEKLKLSFFDTDLLMIDKANLDSYADYIRIALNGQFISIQKEIMVDLSKDESNAVISTGAEVALIPECAAIMKKMGTIIHIQRDPEVILTDSKIPIHSEGIRLYMKDYSQYEALADLSFNNNGTEAEGLEKLLELVNTM